MIGIRFTLLDPLLGYDRYNMCIVDPDGVIVSTGNSINYLHRVKDMRPLKGDDGRYILGAPRLLEIFTKDSTTLVG